MFVWCIPYGLSPKVASYYHAGDPTQQMHLHHQNIIKDVTCIQEYLHYFKARFVFFYGDEHSLLIHHYYLTFLNDSSGV